MTPEEKKARIEELRKQKVDLKDGENLTAEDIIDEEILNRKITDLTVKEFLDVLDKAGGLGGMDIFGGDVNSMLDMSMKMVQEHPEILKEMMKLFSGRRY